MDTPLPSITKLHSRIDEHDKNCPGGYVTMQMVCFCHGKFKSNLAVLSQFTAPYEITHNALYCV